MAPKPIVVCPEPVIGKNFTVGKDVRIEADEITIEDDVSIGVEDETSFRNQGGVRIRVRRLILRSGVSISRGTLMKGGELELGRHTIVSEQSTVDVKDRFVLGDHGYLNPDVRIAGRNIEIGSHAYFLSHSSVGGGSCYEVQSRLRIGRHFHLGEYSMINTAESVTIGNEVGIGMRSAIFTHGAYQSFLKGYPVTFGPVVIGDYCWLPQAIVLPNVTIGSGTVVATGSLVTKSLPPNCLAGGIPAKVIRENAYGTPLTLTERSELMAGFLERLSAILADNYGKSGAGESGGLVFGEGRRLHLLKRADKDGLRSLDLHPGDILISLETDDSAVSESRSQGVCLLATDTLTVIGKTDDAVNMILNQLRRYGVRFLHQD